MSNLIIYDGECIFCQNYVRFVKLRENIGQVELLDARSDDPRISAYTAAGYNLDEGMIFVRDGRVFHGAEAVNILAILSSDRTIASRLNAMAFSNQRISRLLYPLLKAGRRLTLLARGKSLINKAKQNKSLELH
ncbi:DCC1-like thiol-disulfide oxidoreductase family protein [Sphingomonas sp. 37zxx]|uniref:DCC1-like thiol-disulfide oxidoreductase family protein n=1 Tax=Sphingomonas sp. 37zxx TaxID=1550073 RepID=UPI00053BFE95|nr:DCC1-like thiol-disulfide oxidoreductase family protein [Sphingomonas sp. 37zxx]